MADFVFPPISIGTTVEVSADPSRSDTCFGFVVRAKNRSANIACISEEQLVIRSDCLHADDPHCIERPQIFNDGNRGVFILSQAETDRRLLIRQVAAMEKRLADVEARLRKTDK